MFKYSVKINGMGCKKCEARVNEVFLKNGAKKAKASHSKANAVIKSEIKLDMDKIKEEIQEIGYEFVSYEVTE